MKTATYPFNAPWQEADTAATNHTCDFTRKFHKKIGIPSCLFNLHKYPNNKQRCTSKKLCYMTFTGVLITTAHKTHRTAFTVNMNNAMYLRKLRAEEEMQLARLASVEAKIKYAWFVHTYPFLEESKYYKKLGNLEYKQRMLKSHLVDLRREIEDADPEIPSEGQLPLELSSEDSSEESPIQDLETYLANLRDNHPNEYQKVEDEMQRLSEQDAQAEDVEVWEEYTFEELKPYFLQNKRSKSEWRIV